MDVYYHILAILLICGLPKLDAKCPADFENFNMACYLFPTDKVTSMYDARYMCFSMGGYLLNINSELENNFTIGRIQQQPHVFDGYWTGGMYNGQNWVWQKNDNMGSVVSEPMHFDDPQYRFWGPEQPQEGVDFNKEYFVAIMTRRRPVPYRWYSENALLIQNEMSYICEADDSN